MSQVIMYCPQFIVCTVWASGPICSVSTLLAFDWNLVLEVANVAKLLICKKACHLCQQITGTGPGG